MGIEETMIELAAEAGRVKEVTRSLKEERDTLKSRLASAERTLKEVEKDLQLLPIELSAERIWEYVQSVRKKIKEAAVDGNRKPEDLGK